MMRCKFYGGINVNKIKVGIIGYGNIARTRHIPSYKKDKRAEICAIVGPDKNKASKVARDFKIPQYFDCLDDMLDLNLDVVSICTPPGTHSEISIKALKQGVNVLTEKPMAMNHEEATSMVEASKKYGKNLCVAHNFLFSKSMEKVKIMLSKGELGDIQAINALQISSVKRDLPVWYPSLPGRLFYDEIPHMLYTANQFIPNFGIKDIVRVALAESYPSDNLYVDYSSDNIIGSLEMIFNAACSEWKFLVVGTEKVILIDLFRDSLITLSKEASHSPLNVLYSSISVIFQNIYNDFSSGSRLLTKNLLFGHDLLIHKFLNSITDPSISVPVNPNDSKKIVEITDYIIDKLIIDKCISDDKYYKLRI